MRLLTTIALMLAFAGPAWAQDKGMGNQPPAKPAPAESGDATGHDVQAGNAETAGKTTSSSDAKKSKAGAGKKKAPDASPK